MRFVPGPRTLGLLSGGASVGGGTGYGVTQSYASSHEDWRITTLKVAHALEKQGIQEEHKKEITALKKDYDSRLAAVNRKLNKAKSIIQGVDGMIGHLNSKQRSNHNCSTYWSSNYGVEDRTPKVFMLYNVDADRNYDKTFNMQTTGCLK